MGMLPNYKDIVDLIKKGADVEAQEKFLELREEAINFREENIALRERVKDLEETLQLKGELFYERTVYWRILEDGKKDGPYCSTCYDDGGKVIHLHEWGDTWHCRVCKEFPEK